MVLTNIAGSTPSTILGRTNNTSTGDDGKPTGLAFSVIILAIGVKVFKSMMVTALPTPSVRFVWFLSLL